MKTYSDMNETGIYRRVDSREEKIEFYVKEYDDERPRTIIEYVNNTYIEGDDVYYANLRDEDDAPYVSYERVDDFINIAAYLPEPLATILRNPFEDEKGVLYANEGKTLMKAPRKIEGEYVCKDGVEVIYRYAFRDCDELTKLIMPSSLKEIGFCAFYDCEKVVMSLPESLEKIEGSAFSGCKSLEEVIIPAGVAEIKSSLFDGCKSLRRVVLHDGIRQIVGDAFENTDSLFDLELPKNLTELHSYFGFRYSGLTHITIPGSVKCIDRAAFYMCKNLCHVIIEEGVEEIEDAFGECENLAFVELPASLKKVNDSFSESTPVLLIPEGTMEHFKSILPASLHEGLREGKMTEKEKIQLEEKIASLKDEAISRIEEDQDLLDLFD